MAKLRDLRKSIRYKLTKRTPWRTLTPKGGIEEKCSTTSSSGDIDAKSDISFHQRWPSGLSLIESATSEFGDETLPHSVSDPDRDQQHEDLVLLADSLDTQNTEESYGLFVHAFQGEAGFEELRKNTKRTNDVFKEVTSVLQERAEIELTYAKGLHKLAARLEKATNQQSETVIDSSWRYVGDSFTKFANQHQVIGVALRDELATPLKAVCDQQNKLRKTIEGTVDKTMKKLTNRRSEALRHKQKCHSKAKELEIVEKALEDEKNRGVKQLSDKQIAKLQSKRVKLGESLLKSERRYHEASLEAERHRNELEVTYLYAANKLEKIEEQRLVHMQSGLGTYQRRILSLVTTVAPDLTLIISQLEKAVLAPVQDDLRSIVLTTRPKNLSFRNLVLCDFYVEDFCHLMNPDRRRMALERLLQMFQKEVQKEKRGKEGLEYLSSVYERAEPGLSTAETKASVRKKLHDARTTLNYLDYHIYKLQLALCVLDKRPDRPTHHLAKYEEKIKDKANLRQVVLRVPLYNNNDLEAPPTAMHQEYPMVTRVQVGDQNTLELQDTNMYADGEREIYSEASNSESVPASSRASSLSHSVKSSPMLTRRGHHQQQLNLTDKPTVDENFAFLDDAAGELCQALFDFVPQRGDELPLIKGDKIRVIGKESGDWWEGIIVGTEIHGYFPTNYVKRVPDDIDKIIKLPLPPVDEDKENKENSENVKTAVEA